MVRRLRRRARLLLAAAALAAALPAMLACREIDRLAEPTAMPEPGPAAEAGSPPPAAPATGGAAIGKADLIGPVFPTLIGAHSAFCDPTTDPLGCI